MWIFQKIATHGKIIHMLIFYLLCIIIYVCVCDMYVKSQEVFHLNYGVFILSTQTVFI